MQKKNSLFNVGHEVSFWTFKRTILRPFLEKTISKNRVLEVWNFIFLSLHVRVYFFKNWNYHLYERLIFIHNWKKKYFRLTLYLLVCIVSQRSTDYRRSKLILLINAAVASLIDCNLIIFFFWFSLKKLKFFPSQTTNN